ncbi:putative alpha-glycosyltransferase/ family 4 [Synechococcus sp. A18-25c]|uniref:glycosyltransferase n=1 Tax=Synechococcus sp. A18-25c TaxID=1866938 RepID=UPI001647F448|nr:glycosyltransferase [Synechococcus sp. A18-25c]QNJ18461.1 putative alpha-glycosyltransferase/ family 4 [Synechococcus sp. A18-25c]
MQSQPLKGQKILVTAYDLEQSEHRGIAVYSKSLMRCLYEAGAEVWLLTEFFDSLSEKGLKRLPKRTQVMIHNARILNSLALGRRERPTTVLERKFKLARKAKRWGNYLRLIGNLLRRPRQYKAKELNSFRLQELYDNPYVRIERLDYLECVTGIVSAPELYLSTQLAAQLPKLRPVRIDLRGFDTLITTCPLNISPHNLRTFVQTIHDLIPLEYVAHNEDPLMFSHRLQSCLPARRLFVSQSTANKYSKHIQNTNQRSSRGADNSNEAVIIQSPSLRFPNWLTEDPEQIADLQPVSHLLRNEAQTNPGKSSSKSKNSVPSKKILKPFSYFLFNSSVEARKNILFLAKAYAESDLYKMGIKLCVTGKLKGDDYSKALQDIVAHEPGIILTGYVDESSKLDLYLNALGLLSPSLVEGFGIPVLDGACLGTPTVASDCESHLEIQGLHDFDQHVLCLDTLDSREWAAALQAVAGTNLNLADHPAQTRRERIGRYCQFQTLFTDQLQHDLVTILK